MHLRSFFSSEQQKRGANALSYAEVVKRADCSAPSVESVRNNV
jgi:hypothetical protein